MQFSYLRQQSLVIYPSPHASSHRLVALQFDFDPPTLRLISFYLPNELFIIETNKRTAG